MLNTIKVEVKPQDIIAAVKKMKKKKGTVFWKIYSLPRLQNTSEASKRPEPIIRLGELNPMKRFLGIEIQPCLHPESRQRHTRA